METTETHQPAAPDWVKKKMTTTFNNDTYPELQNFVANHVADPEVNTITKLVMWFLDHYRDSTDALNANSLIWKNHDKINAQNGLLEIDINKLQETNATQADQLARAIAQLKKYKQGAHTPDANPQTAKAAESAAATPAPQPKAETPVTADTTETDEHFTDYLF